MEWTDMPNRLGPRFDFSIDPKDLFKQDVLGLLASNALVIGWAFIERWSLDIVMLIYWMQKKPRPRAE